MHRLPEAMYPPSQLKAQTLPLQVALAFDGGVQLEVLTGAHAPAPSQPAASVRTPLVQLWVRQEAPDPG
jgi:hypothetical protein